MLKFSHATLTFASGLVWLIVGFFLLPLGLGLLTGQIQPVPNVTVQPLVKTLSPYLGGAEEAGLLLIAISIYVGFLKGKYVLGKSARRGVDRLRGFPNPTSIGNIYSAKYYILLGSMVVLGFSIKFLGLPTDIRGIVDVIIGSALINGAIIYFRLGFLLRKEHNYTPNT
jgi:hypothetical protein